jgi:hypothetical protein
MGAMLPASRVKQTRLRLEIISSSQTAIRPISNVLAERVKL